VHGALPGYSEARVGGICKAGAMEDPTSFWEYLSGLSWLPISVGFALALAFPLWLILMYLNLRGTRREVEAIKDSLEIQVLLTEKLLAKISPPQQPPSPDERRGS
jgi:hypothetical protein